MIIPTGYSHVLLGFTGVYVPTGAAMTFGVQNVGNETPVDLATSVLVQWQGASVDDLYTDGVSLTEIKVKNGPNSTGAQGVISPNVLGNQTGPGIAPNCTMLIQKNTGLGGREGRGRFNLPGIQEEDVDGAGNLDAIFLAAANPVWDDFLNGLITADLPMVLLHNSATAPTPVTSLNVSSRIATIRRRLRR